MCPVTSKWLSVVGPHLKTKRQMVHVLPGHAVHVPEVNVVRRVQLIEASPIVPSLGSLLPEAMLYSALRRGCMGTGRVTPPSIWKAYASISMVVPAPVGIRARTYITELVVAFQREVNPGATRTELLDGPAA